MTQRNALALMHHAMQENLARRRQMMLAALAGRQPGLSPEEAEKLQMTEARIYIGLNDAETRAQTHATEQYVALLKDVCKTYRVAFSMDIAEGGYYHEDGGYTEETSLVLTLIDVERDTVQKIAQDLRARFHQESVLVTEDRIGGYFVTE